MSDVLLVNMMIQNPTAISGSDKQEIKEIIMQRKDYKNTACMAYHYCRDVDNDDEVRQIILSSKIPFWIIAYCENVSDDADMRAALDADISETIDI